MRRKTYLIFEEGNICSYLDDYDVEDEDIEYVKEYIQNTLESFLRHNLVITSEVFCVICGMVI